MDETDEVKSAFEFADFGITSEEFDSRSRTYSDARAAGVVNPSSDNGRSLWED